MHSPSMVSTIFFSGCDNYLDIAVRMNCMLDAIRNPVISKSEKRRLITTLRQLLLRCTNSQELADLTPMLVDHPDTNSWDLTPWL